MSSNAAAKKPKATAGTEEVDHIVVGTSDVTLQAQRAVDDKFQGMQGKLGEFEASLKGRPEVEKVQLGSLGCPSEPRSVTVFVVTVKDIAPAELLAQWHKAQEPFKGVGVIVRGRTWTSSLKLKPTPA